MTLVGLLLSILVIKCDVVLLPLTCMIKMLDVVTCHHKCFDLPSSIYLPNRYMYFLFKTYFHLRKLGTWSYFHDILSAMPSSYMKNITSWSFGSFSLRTCEQVVQNYEFGCITINKIATYHTPTCTMLIDRFTGTAWT